MHSMGFHKYVVAHWSTYHGVWGRVVYAPFLGGLLSLAANIELRDEEPCNAVAGYDLVLARIRQ